MKRKIFTIVIIVIFLMSTVIACSSNTYTATKESNYVREQSFAVSDSMSDEYYEVPTEAYYEDEGISKDNNTSYVDTEYLAKGAKIIYSGTVALETKEYDKDKVELQNLIKNYNGIIDSQYETNNNYDWYYSSSVSHKSSNRKLSISFRVPVEKFDEFTSALNSLNSHVTKFSINSNDVTKTYNQNKNRIESLETQRDRLLEMMNYANSVSELLEIESRLSDIDYQLKNLNNANDSIDYDVTYSPFSVTLSEVDYYEDVVPPTFGERFKNSISESWEQFVEFLQDASIALVYIAPFLFIIAIIVVIIIAIVKSSKNKKRKKLIAEREKAKALNMISDEQKDNMIKNSEIK